MFLSRKKSTLTPSFKMIFLIDYLMPHILTKDLEAQKPGGLDFGPI